MSLKLRIIPDPVLRKIASPITAMDKDTSIFMQDMLEAMYTNKGIGLAAPQVGDLRRVIVMDTAEEQNPDYALVMANPQVIWKSEELFTYNEGCLSIPGQYADITRPQKARVSYIDKDGKKSEIELEDLASSCVQHEIDHLNGVLFFDYISKLKRDMMIRKVEKAQRIAEDETSGKVL